jgi:3-hydroxybutyryl-CoA dehydratase
MKQGDTFTHHFIVTDEIYNKFLELFEDRNPLHTDAAFALSRGFREVVMHGNILNGFLSHFIGECLPNKNVIIHSQRIKYSKPVYIKDHLMLIAKIVGVHESVNVLDFKFHFQNQDNVKVATGEFQIGLLT